jgi:hypothetical protein
MAAQVSWRCHSSGCSRVASPTSSTHIRVTRSCAGSCAMRLVIAMAVCLLRYSYAFRPAAAAGSRTVQYSVSAKTCASRAVATRAWSVREKTENQYEKIWDRVTVETRGDEALAKELVEGMRLQWAFGFPNTPAGMSQLTHGSHYYPAGMQPAMAKHLLETVLPGDSLLGEAAFSKVMYTASSSAVATLFLAAVPITLHFCNYKASHSVMLTSLHHICCCCVSQIHSLEGAQCSSKD